MLTASEEVPSFPTPFDVDKLWVFGGLEEQQVGKVVADDDSVAFNRAARGYGHGARLHPVGNGFVEVLGVQRRGDGKMVLLVGLEVLASSADGVVILEDLDEVAHRLVTVLEPDSVEPDGLGRLDVVGVVVDEYSGPGVDIGFPDNMLEELGIGLPQASLPRGESTIEEGPLGSVELGL